MVKFQARWMKKRYKKNKEYKYKKYLMEFPTKLNQKIEPHIIKNFDDAGITFKETPEREFLNISLIRKKPLEEFGKEEPE